MIIVIVEFRAQWGRPFLLRRRKFRNYFWNWSQCFRWTLLTHYSII